MNHNKYLFTEDHEWIENNDDTATIGITDYAQSELGDIIFIELPEKGDYFKKGEVFGTIEAVKTVADLFMPVSGKIIDVNSGIENNPELINNDPFDKGWIVKISIENKTEVNTLLKIDDYNKITNE
tara:strand:- start:256 stop:633 length:378 start_codon:yes stop_codon:yes gene_type:complete